MKAEVKFWEHVVSREGVATDPTKIEVVKDWPTPSEVRQVRSFLGLASYYRRFVPTFAKIAAPLHSLKNKKFEWTSECDKAFVRLNYALISSPILAMPNDTDPFLLDSDACDVSIGAVLPQVQNGVERVIAYASRSLSKPERNYCVTRKELLAIVCYTKMFRQYLLGKQFVVRTDHSALPWLRTTLEPIGQQARWCEILEEFDFQIVHRLGRLHGNANAMSRRTCRQCGNDGENKTAIQMRAINFTSIGDSDRWSKKEIAEATEKDAELFSFSGWVKDGMLPLPSNDLTRHDPAFKTLHAQWERFIVNDGILYQKFWKNDQDGDSWQLVSPVGYQKEIMSTAHASVTGGHMGVKKVQTKVAKQAYWVGWSRDVRDFC